MMICWFSLVGRRHWRAAPFPSKTPREIKKYGKKRTKLPPTQRERNEREKKKNRCFKTNFISSHPDGDPFSLWTANSWRPNQPWNITPQKRAINVFFFQYFYFLPKWKFFYHVFFYELALRRAYSVAIGDRGKRKEKEKRKEKKEKKRISQENSQQFPSPASQSSFGCCGKGLAALPCCVSWTTLPGWSLFFRQYFTILRSWVLMRFVFQWGKRCNNMETFLNRRISSPTEQVFRAERQSRVDYSSPECIPKMKKKNKNKNKKKNSPVVLFGPCFSFWIRNLLKRLNGKRKWNLWRWLVESKADLQGPQDRVVPVQFGASASLAARFA